MSRRRTAEEWREILDGQRRLGQTDRECSVLHGVDHSSLKRWRGRLGLGRTGGQSAFVELPVSQAPASEMRIILPNKVELAVGPGWSADQVAAVAVRLAVL